MKRYTASNIDLSDDTYHNPLWIAILWLCFVLIYLLFFFNTTPKLFIIDCAPDDNGTAAATAMRHGCMIAQTILYWFEIFIKTSIIGLVFLFLFSFSNSTIPTGDSPSSDPYYYKKEQRKVLH